MAADLSARLRSLAAQVEEAGENVLTRRARKRTLSTAGPVLLVLTFVEDGTRAQRRERAADARQWRCRAAHAAGLAVRGARGLWLWLCFLAPLELPLALSPWPVRQHCHTLRCSLP